MDKDFRMMMVDKLFNLMVIEYGNLFQKNSGELVVKIVDDLKLIEDKQWYFVFTNILGF